MMKKYFIATLALLSMFCFTNPAKAQLPFPGQSIPMFVSREFQTYTDINGSNISSVMKTTAENSNNPYWLYQEAMVWKFMEDDGIWFAVKMVSFGPVQNQAYQINTFTSTISTSSIYAQEGAGWYQFICGQYAYNPVSKARIFLWNNAYTFYLSDIQG